MFRIVLRINNAIKESGALNQLSWFMVLLFRLMLMLEHVLMKGSDFFIRSTTRINNRVTGNLTIKFYKLVVKSVMPNRIRHDLYKKTLSHSLPLKASFASAVILRNSNCAKRELPEWILNSKTCGVRFVKQLGLLVPEQYQEKIPFEDICLREATVIKPEDEHSAKGVFIAKSKNEVMELNTGATYHSERDLKIRINQLLLNDVVRSDLWTVQQLIESHDGEFVSDIKFFAFYGIIEVIAEMKRYPKVLCDMFDRNNVSFDSGLYPKNKCYKGMGVSMDEIKWAEHISLEIPAPFIRIDFLRGKDGMYFCEFTPRPGSVGQFNSKYDHKLGVMFHEAEARLHNDLIKGKSFSSFKMIAKC